MNPTNTPPHSIEAEQAVIGGLLLDNQAWEKIADRIYESDFYRLDHRMIFKAIGTLEAKDQPFDVVTLSQWLAQTDELDEIGGMAYLGRLAKDTPSAANILAYADIVRERSVLRQLIAAGTSITSNAFNSKDCTSADLLDQAGQKIHAIGERLQKIDGGPMSASQLLPGVLSALDDRHANGGGITGLGTGFIDLDKKLTGLHPGELIIVAGRPSMGKTTFAMNVAEAVTIRQNHGTLVFSLEMPSESLIERQVASLAKINFQSYRSGTLQESDYDRVTQVSSKIDAAPLYIDDTPALSVDDIRARARRLHRKQPISLIIIDYLQLMSGNSKQNENRNLEVMRISQGLKSLAKELQLPVIALSQLNRSLEQRSNRRPVMSDLRDSGAIEQDADVIMFLYRDEVYDAATTEKGVAELIIGKQRNGPIGTIFLSFQGEYLRFESLPNYTPPESSQKPASAKRYSGGFDYSKVSN